jgi:hypothetical protein
MADPKTDHFDTDVVIMHERNGPDSKRSVQIIVWGEPRVPVEPADEFETSKMAFGQAVAHGLALYSQDSPEFVGTALELNVEFHVLDVSKDVASLLKFVLDALATVVYTDPRVIYRTQIHKKPVFHPDDALTFLLFEAIKPA